MKQSGANCGLPSDAKKMQEYVLSVMSWLWYGLITTTAANLKEAEDAMTIFVIEDTDFFYRSIVSSSFDRKTSRDVER
ncbi:hypothetical protein DVH05_009896 [Phytophthora capsici]|nr:hypothetical protein DVH05_009896 [Phytophthora capsici]